MSEIVERLGDVDWNDEIEVTLADGTVFAGRVSPINYVPEERLRIEVQPTADENVRYEISSNYDDGGWSPAEVRRIEVGEDDWTPLAEVESVNVDYHGGETG